MSPLDQNQTDRLFPQQIYSKDPNEFGLTPANLSDIRPHQVYLVKNLTFLNTVVSFLNFCYKTYNIYHPS